jgi:hypothetical protein
MVGIRNTNPAGAEAMTEIKGLPVAGYRDQNEATVALVNANKQAEESILRLFDALGQIPEIDKRWLAIGRTDIEKGFMAVNRSIFKPARVRLPTDPVTE